MLEHEFWQLIESSKIAGGGPSQTQKQSEFLGTTLSKMDKQPIIDFKVIFETKLVALDSWELAAVQFLSLDYLSDDSFNVFRAWIVAQGEKTYTEALEEPASLANTLIATTKEHNPDVVLEGGEYFLYCADTVYENLFGEDIWDEMPEDTGKDVTNGPQPFDEQNICAVYPHLCAKFKKFV